MAHEEHTHSGNAGLAFGLTVATAVSFAFGAVLPFFCNAKNGAFLSNALSFSAGIMLFVSLVEIYGKAYDGFAEVYCPNERVKMCTKAFGATLGTFIAGCIIIVLIQSLNKGSVYKKYSAWLSGKEDSEEETEASHSDLPSGWQVGFDKASQRVFYYHPPSQASSWTFPGEPSSSARTPTPKPPASPSSPPSGPPHAARSGGGHGEEEGQGGAFWPLHSASHLHSAAPPRLWPLTAPGTGQGLEGVPEVSGAGLGLTESVGMSGRAFGGEEEGGKGDEEGQDAPPACPAVENEEAEMLASGIVTAVAIAIHNFPEGFVTFMATYKDSRVGASVAFAIAMHNIPEGVCVGAPVYYSTRSKLNTIAAGVFGGIWAPVGGAVAWAAFGAHEDMDGRAYGCMFGLVSGMMTMLSLNELLPLAARYSNSKTLNDLFLILGLLTMGLSILLFEV